MFRQSVRQVFLFECAVGLPIYSALVLIEERSHFDPVAFLVGAVCGSLFALFVAWMLSRLLPVGISPDGVSGYSFWGFRRFIRWEHIAAARPFRMLNLRFVRLYSGTDGKTTWVALYPENANAFRDAVLSAMPSNSPLSRYIR